MAKELTPEEQRFFESGGTSEMPEGYADDAMPHLARDEGDGGQEGGADQNAAQEAQGEAKDGQPQAEAGQGEKAPEQPAAAQNEQGGEQGKGPVPYGAMKEERERRREAERKYQLLLERTNAMLAAQQGQGQQPQQPEPEPAPQMPDPDADPHGALKFVANQIAEQKRQEQEYRTQSEQEAQQRDFEVRVVDGYQRAMHAAIEAAPPVRDAHNHYYFSRVAAYEAQGYNRQQAEGYAKREEFALAQNALSQGRNPAEVIVRAAFASGWRMPEQQPQGQQPQNGGQAQPAGAPDAQREAERLEQIRRGQEANASVSTAGTSANARGGRLDAKALEAMSDKEFAAFLAKDDGEGWKKALGG